MKKYNNTVSIYLKSNFNADAENYINNIEYMLLKQNPNSSYDVSKYKGIPQPIYIEDGNTYRLRSEIIVLDGYKIMINRVKPRVFPYSFPGGGVDKGENIVIAASRECEEESLIVPKNVEFVNIAWYQKYPEPIMYNYGAISLLCVGQKYKKYTGYVKKNDRDEFVDNIEWIDYRTLKLGEPHIVAIERYLDMHPIEKKFQNHLYK